jgi:hypothetical protein
VDLHIKFTLSHLLVHLLLLETLKWKYCWLVAVEANHLVLKVQVVVVLEKWKKLQRLLLQMELTPLPLVVVGIMLVLLVEHHHLVDYLPQ